MNLEKFNWLQRFTKQKRDCMKHRYRYEDDIRICIRCGLKEEQQVTDIVAGTIGWVEK